MLIVRARGNRNEAIIAYLIAILDLFRADVASCGARIEEGLTALANEQGARETRLAPRASICGVITWASRNVEPRSRR